MPWPLLAALTAALIAFCSAAAGKEAAGKRAAGSEAAGESSAAASGGESVLLRAMRDELARSMASLQLEDLERPYFLAYRVDEYRGTGARASFGAFLDRSDFHSRGLTLELRIGSPAFDNTNYLPSRTWSAPQTRSYSLPLADDYDELRRSLWLATDRAYKHALETIARKRGTLQSQTREAVPDFEPSAGEREGAPLARREPSAGEREPYVDLSATVRRPLPRPPGVEALRDVVLAGSALFRDLPAVAHSQVRGYARHAVTTYVNSEGAAYVSYRPSATLHATAAAQAADGTVVQDTEHWHRGRWEELPPKAEVLARIRVLAQRLEERLGAAPIDRYNGPVLFEGQAAAEIIAQALVPRLLGHREPVAEQRGGSAFAASLGNPFADRIGSRVMARSLSVVDDPTATANTAGPLYGGFAVDGQGVAAAPKTVVQAGMLKTLLTSRNPLPGVAGSGGNLRGAQVLPSNLLVSARRGLEPAALREELLLMAAERGNEYAVIVRRLDEGGFHLMPDRPRGRSSDGPAVGLVLEAAKVWPDGHEEPIRKAQLAGFSVAAFRDIVAASTTASNHTRAILSPNAYALRTASALYGTSAEGTGRVTTISTPALLFEELTLRKPAGNVPRPPIAPHPYFAEASD